MKTSKNNKVKNSKSVNKLHEDLIARRKLNESLEQELEDELKEYAGKNFENDEFSVELNNPQEANVFKKVLEKHDYGFETSQNGKKTHFEVFRKKLSVEEDLQLKEDNGKANYTAKLKKVVETMQNTAKFLEYIADQYDDDNLSNTAKKLIRDTLPDSYFNENSLDFVFTLLDLSDGFKAWAKAIDDTL